MVKVLLLDVQEVIMAEEMVDFPLLIIKLKVAAEALLM